MLPIIRNAFDQSWLPSVFNDFFDNSFMARTNATAPAINVVESEADYKVEVAAPGMGKDDFKINLNDNDNLVITMEKKSEQHEDNKQNKRYLRREFSYSKYQQTLILPDDVDRDKIGATMNNGVLGIQLPKLAPEAKVSTNRMIEIH